jgi:hypothetical protein
LKGGTRVAMTTDETASGERSWKGTKISHGTVAEYSSMLQYLLGVCDSTNSCIQSGIGHYEGGVATKIEMLHHKHAGSRGQGRIFTHRGSLMSNTMGLGGRLGDCQNSAGEDKREK